MLHPGKYAAACNRPPESVNPSNKTIDLSTLKKYETISFDVERITKKAPSREDGPDPHFLVHLPSAKGLAPDRGRPHSCALRKHKFTCMTS